MAVSDEVESPPPTKKMHYSVKHESDSSDSDGSGKSSGSSDSSSESSSESLEEEMPKGKYKRKLEKKEAVKVQNKDTHHKAKKAKHKQSLHHDEGPKMKRRKESEQEEPSVKVHKTAVDDSGLKSALEKEAKSSSEGTIAIPAEDYKSLLEFVR